VSEPLPPGQRLNHARYGLGTATLSDERRTTIDFDEHGVKIFVTEMLQATLVDGPAPPRPKRGRAAKTTAAKTTAAKTTAAKPTAAKTTT
jgi:hypothetical protein